MPKFKDWIVRNAINRDVERQQLNTILADIRSSVDEVSIAASEDVRDQIGTMVSNNTEDGISVTYNVLQKVFDFVVNSFRLTLDGDVTGSVEISGLHSATLTTSINPDLLGVPEAPIDNTPYWRENGDWDQVPQSLVTFGDSVGIGFPAQAYDDVEHERIWNYREFEAAAGELTIDNGTGEDGNPLYGLADLADSGVGVSPVQLFTRDAKGRVEGTEDADTDDLPEGVTNLYFTTERDYLAAKALLIAGANITFTYDDVLFTITIDGTGGGGGGTVVSVTGDTGITVDNTDPDNPIVQLDSASQASLLLADSALQPGDSIPATDVSGLATVATTGDYSDLSGLPTLGTAAAADVADFDPVGAASAAEAAAEAYTDTALVDYTPTSGLGTAAFTDSTDYATAAQGTTAASATQPGDNVSTLVNDAGYLTSLSGAVPTSRNINTTAPLTGGGDLSADRTLAISAATTGAAGSMSAADKTKLNGISTGATANTGTVTSVGLSAPTGLTAGGTPVTTSGVLTLTYSAGYQGYTATEASKLSGIAAGATAYTDALARAAVVIDSIADADTTHAPSRNSVFDALALKFDKTGGTISGDSRVERSETAAATAPTFAVSNTASTGTNEAHYDMLSNTLLSRFYWRSSAAPTFGYFADLGDGAGGLTRLRFTAAGWNFENSAAVKVGGVSVMVGEDSGWVSLTGQNSWASLGGAFGTIDYRKIGKQVTLRGVLGGGTITNNTVVTALPSGYRPSENILFPAGSSSSMASARLTVLTTGDIQLRDVDSNSFLSLGNITFFVD